MSLVTIPHIDLISVGAWKAHGSSPGKTPGEIHFTLEDLRDIMASQDAPDVKSPRMILGHTDMSAGPGMSELADEGFFGEQPAIGKFVNLSLEGETIYGDLVGVPQWLADIIPTAYANRSVEVYWDVPSGIPDAKMHKCIMPRVALLGTGLPAVATLEDLKTFFSDEGPDDLDFQAAASCVAASHTGHRVSASVGVEELRREFYESFATSEDERYWWWITALYVEPQVAICDDDEGGLWSVPYAVNGDAIEFGDPVQVKVQYVDEVGRVAASTVPGGRIGQQYTKAALSRPDNRAKENGMKINVPVLRARMGLTEEQLPDDATEEQINSVLAETDPGEGGGDGEPEPKPGEGEEQEEQEQQPPASDASKSSTVTVDREQWDEMQRSMAALEEDRTRRVEQNDVEYITAAVKAGKFPPSRKEHWATLMKHDREGTRAVIDGLEAVIPVEQRELGSASDPADAGVSAAAYDPTWLTDGERARVEAMQAGAAGKPRIVSEA